jgi:hypothetical protein
MRENRINYLVQVIQPSTKKRQRAERMCFGAAKRENGCSGDHTLAAGRIGGSEDASNWFGRLVLLLLLIDLTLKSYQFQWATAQML